MKLSAAINRQSAAITNVQNAISFAQLQDGDLSSAAKIVDRMTTLRSLYDDVTKSTLDKDNYNTEFQSLRVQLYQLSDGTFNGISLFSRETWGEGNVAATDYIEVLTSERGSGGSKISLGKINLISALNVKGQTVDTYVVAEQNPDTALAVDTKGKGTNTSLGDFSVDSLILALQNLSTLRAENGATQARFGFALDHLEQNRVNMEAANGRIKDVDIATESTRFARYNILMQAGAAMLAQANVDHSNVAQRLIM
jgi:flagellin